VTTPSNEPGDRPPAAARAGAERPLLDRPPGDRYVAAANPDLDVAADGGRLDAVFVPVALVLGSAIAFVLFGAILLVTAGLIVLAAFLGWLTGRLVAPPRRAAAVGLTAVVVGLLAIWLFGRIEGGVLNPIDYLLEVEGPIVVVLSLLAGGGLAAAASR
jgi:hypothetical protein